MTDKDVQETIDLFENNYGVWAANENIKRIPGNSIKVPFLKKTIVDKPDRFVVMAYDNGKLIGYAYYMRRKTPTGKMVTWILQLVVDKAYRGNGIGTKIMYSIWEMSDSWAWGLYTSNPFTIKCLQDATMRKVKKNVIKQHLDELKTVSYDLFQDMKWIDSYEDGIVDTQFPIDFSDTVENFHRRFPNEKFDLNEKLEVGHEWLAFVFSEQRPKPTDQQIKKYLNFSDEITKDAFSKMEMDNHAWAAYTDSEVKFIIREANNPGSIMDLGCGRGRHSIKFAEYGIDTTGVDYVEMSSEAKLYENEQLHFECADARAVKLGRSFDAVIALYDIVGSYPNEYDNLMILNTAYRHLNARGRLIISVMNMNLTREECKRHKNIVSGLENNAYRLITLKGSNTMQKNGQVFNGKYILLDANTGVCFRKEQFFCENNLPIEYIVKDRRYTKEGITKLVSAAGFIVEKCYYVQAGRFDKELEPYDSRAKEILVVARKGTYLNKIFASHDIECCWN